MNQFGFYSHIHEVHNCSLIYKNINNEIMKVTQIVNFEDEAAALKLFDNIYLVAFPDAQFIGQLVEQVNQPQLHNDIRENFRSISNRIAGKKILIRNGLMGNRFNRSPS